MELKSGYKKTDIGLLPDQWEAEKLGKHAKFRTGPFGSALHQSDYVDDGVPVINPTQIVDGRIVPTPSMAVSQQAARKLADFRLEAGNVVIGRRGEMGRCAYVRADENGWLCGTGSMIIRTAPSLDARYIQRVLSSSPIITAIENASVGSTMINLNQGTLGNLIVPIPPTKAEQEAIADALNDADSLIECLAQLIAKKRFIKQGAMQQLLTGKKRLPGFSQVHQRHHQTKFGSIPIDWRPTALERIAAFITKGSTPTTYGFAWRNEGILFLRSECVSENGLDLSQSMFISNEAHHALRRSQVRGGDILITITGNVGRVAHLCGDFGEANINQHIARLRLFEDQVSALFVFHFLSQPLVRRYYNLITTGQAYPQISLRQVRETEVPLPSLAEQSAIATVLSDMDAELSVLQVKLAKAYQIKQGMMQELLTGRIRLV